jgi:hypothetical protein
MAQLPGVRSHNKFPQEAVEASKREPEGRKKSASLCESNPGALSISLRELTPAPGHRPAKDGPGSINGKGRSTYQVGAYLPCVANSGIASFQPYYCRGIIHSSLRGLQRTIAGRVSRPRRRSPHAMPLMPLCLLLEPHTRKKQIDPANQARSSSLLTTGEDGVDGFLCLAMESSTPLRKVSDSGAE